MKPEDFFYKEILDNLYDGVYFVDKDRKITYWNTAAEKITGYKKENVQHTFCFDNKLRHIDEKGTELCIEGCPLYQTIIDGKLRESEEIFLHHKNGHRVPIYIRVAPIKNEMGEITGAVEIFSEKSSKVEIENRIKELEKKLYLDNLTGIPNRAFMEEIINNKLSYFQGAGNTFGLLFIDIDNFKSVNDTYGHDVGDEVLKVVSATLIKNIRSVDMVSRWGGEEFVALVSDADKEGLSAVANKFIILVRHSDVTCHELVIKVTISIGATLVQENDTLTSLVKRADELMYISKKNGKNRATID